ncbi:MAG: hypothetical protein D6674_05105 [Acidobacteria bacterium]|nr:MAG: hypothetical protein D6674_05105 [Acidobacteriota bacterium]
MPIQESYKRESLSRVERLGKVFEEILKLAIEEVDPEDLEFGINLDITSQEAEELWRDCVEENNYMEVVYTEITEHHDGAYLKATFRNATDNFWEERYVSVRSSGRVELGHAFFLLFEGKSARIERVGEARYRAFVKAQ